MNRRLPLLAIAGIIVTLVIGFPLIVGWAADWFWFRSIGFQVVFLKQFRTELALGVGVGLFAFAFLYTNLRFAQRGATLPVMVGTRGGQPIHLDVTGLVRRLAWPAAIVVSLIVAVS